MISGSSTSPDFIEVSVSCCGQKATAETAATSCFSGISAFCREILLWLGGAAPADAAIFFAVGAAQIAVGAGLPHSLFGRSAALAAFQIHRFERIASRRAASFGACAHRSRERGGEELAPQAVFHTRVGAKREGGSDLNAGGALGAGLGL